MDRQNVYPGQILPETTLLQMTKDAMIGLAKLSAAVLGTSTTVNGFAVTPTSPASLQVYVAPGEIYSLQNVDNTAFSSLAADTTHQIVKQGISLDQQTLTLSAPTTPGQSINYLIQASYADIDSTPVLLPYYNSANPNSPYSGQGNNGLTQNTVRKGSVVLTAKAGVPATTGSQVTPAPDSGYVGLCVVTVAYGQTQIVAGNISQYSAAPLLPSGLLQSIQTGNVSFGTDTGTANAYVVTCTPALQSRTEGQVLRFKVKTSNTGACTLNDGVGTAPLVGGAHAALQGGELVANGDAWAQWNSSVGSGSYILLYCTGGAQQVPNATQSQHAVALGQFVSSLAANGYQKFPSGLIIQWGLASITAQTSAGLPQIVTLPIAFPNSCLTAIGGSMDGWTTTGAYIVGAAPYSTSQIYVNLVRSSGAMTVGVRWVAIGY